MWRFFELHPTAGCPGAGNRRREQTTIDVARAVIAAGGKALSHPRRTHGRRLVSTAAPRPDAGAVEEPAGHGWQRRAPVDLIRTENVTWSTRGPGAGLRRLWPHATRTPFVTTYTGSTKRGSNFKRWYNAVMTRGDL